MASANQHLLVLHLQLAAALGIVVVVNLGRFILILVLDQSGSRLQFSM